MVSRYFSSTAVLESDDTCIVVNRYYRFRYYRYFTVSRNSFEARIVILRMIVIAILLKTKPWYLQSQINEED